MKPRPVRGGWSVRQLGRQVATLAYQRSATRQSPGKRSADDVPTPETEIKDPFVLEFLGLKDEYSESELEEGLIRELEQFLLELGNHFAFIARQNGLGWHGTVSIIGHAPFTHRDLTESWLLADIFL